MNHSGSKDLSLKRALAGGPCFIIAEAGVNHNGDIALACQLVQLAAHAGADAVKFQTFKASRLATANAAKAEYQVRNGDPLESQWEMLKRLELSEEAFAEIFRCCRAEEILFLSTPFDEESADFLERLGVEAFKTGSGELTNLRLLAHIGAKGKPILVSTGMATLDEVRAAVETVTSVGNSDLILLHCVSNYPAEPSEVNLRAMQTMASAFNVPVGYSDHTLGIDIALAARALGACVIEKHFTLDRRLPGPDHRCSLTGPELTAMVEGIRHVESALGDGEKKPGKRELRTAALVRRSLVAARDICAGSALTEDLVCLKRPGTGLSPEMQQWLLGVRAFRKGKLEDND